MVIQISLLPSTCFSQGSRSIQIVICPFPIDQIVLSISTTLHDSPSRRQIISLLTNCAFINTQNAFNLGPDRITTTRSWQKEKQLGLDGSSSEPMHQSAGISTLSSRDVPLKQVPKPGVAEHIQVRLDRSIEQQARPCRSSLFVHLFAGTLLRRYVY